MYAVLDFYSHSRNNFNYSSIQYLQKWTNYIIDYISCIVCFVLVDRSMEQSDKMEIASWNLNQLSIGIIQTCGFSDEYFASYQYYVWFLYAKGTWSQCDKPEKKTIWRLIPLYNLKLTFLHTFFKIFHRSFWYVDILNILFQERRVTFLSGFPTASIVVIFIILISLPLALVWRYLLCFSTDLLLGRYIDNAMRRCCIIFHDRRSKVKVTMSQKVFYCNKSIYGQRKISLILELNLSGKPDREVALLSCYEILEYVNTEKLCV